MTLGRVGVVSAVLTALLISGCGLDVSHEKRPERVAGKPASLGYEDPGSIFGEGGLMILGGEGPSQEGGGIGVNSFLWRASLDTISFMPLASADPFGGVIITDWYTPPEVRDERFKVTVYILGRDLRADGVRAAVFRQRQDGDGGWIDARVEQRTAVDLEDAILTRARQLRIAGIQ